MESSKTADASLSDNRIGLGVAMMFLGDFLFAANDALGKWLVTHYSVGQVLFIRSIAAFLLLLPLVHRQVNRQGYRSLVKLERPRTQVLRVCFATGEVLCFYAAVAYLPLADVMTFYLAGPIYVAALSPWFLGEKVGWRRWVAILVGFIGVVIALEPSAASLSLPAIISVIGSFVFALMILQSRQLRATPDTTLVFWQIIGALSAGTVIAPFNWQPPTAPDLVLMATLGIVSTLAHMCINRSLKLAPAALVAPIQYTLLLWALIFGYFIFDDTPKPAMIIGGVIIIAAGLFIFERRKKRQEVTQADIQEVA